jgi:hypothetical protein
MAFEAGRQVAEEAGQFAPSPRVEHGRYDGLVGPLLGEDAVD